MDPDQVVAELVGMGFKLSDFTNSAEVVGPSIDGAIDYLLDDSRRNTAGASTSTACFSSRAGMLGKRGSSSSSCSAGKIRQSSINKFIQSAIRPKRSKTMNKLNMSRSEILQRDTGGQNVHPPLEDSDLHVAIDKLYHHLITKMKILDQIGKTAKEGQEFVAETLWTFIVEGFSEGSSRSLVVSLRLSCCCSNRIRLAKEGQEFVAETLWTFIVEGFSEGGSRSLIIPALLTGKVVIVISPLISLMHDQCLKLAKHGVSACFLGSCQTDRSVEQKAMAGVYSIIYVCPETILRLIKLLQSLAESHGIALVAVHEVHCVSKWGHDFPPDYRVQINKKELITKPTTVFAGGSSHWVWGGVGSPSEFWFYVCLGT
ncbi:hypothetical protein KY284_002707 [Solanum tuberosum]|nr:hypothetical protein KY284_002707 [Solanum tuberosum]